jgi:hypothetical protein
MISRPFITLTQNTSIWEAFGSLGVLNREFSSLFDAGVRPEKEIVQRNGWVGSG